MATAFQADAFQFDPLAFQIDVDTGAIVDWLNMTDALPLFMELAEDTPQSLRMTDSLPA